MKKFDEKHEMLKIVCQQKNSELFIVFQQNVKSYNDIL